MSRFFHDTDDSWFRLGRLPVTSTVAVVLAGAIGILVTIFVGGGLVVSLAYSPHQLLQGQVWRPFTWPFVDGFSIWTVLNLVFLWLFGRDLEAQLGRKKMAWLFVGIWGSMTLAFTLVGFIAPGMLFGLGMVELAVLLLWIAEGPNRQFFFGIPAWAFGIFIVAMQVLSYLAARAWGGLLAMLLSMVLVAIAARSVGLLSLYPWIPGGPLASRPTRQRPAAPRPSHPTKGHSRHPERRVSDEARIDQLLDKINEGGFQSLTKAERNELEKLRLRRR